MAEAAEERRPEEGTDEEGAQKKPRGIIRVLGILLVAIGLAGGGALGATFLGPAVGAKMAGGAEKEADGGGHGAAAAEEPASDLHVIENLVVNPAGTEGTRFLLVSVAVAPRKPLTVETLAGMDLGLRDALIRVLGAKSVEELVSIADRDALVEELMTAIEKVTGPDTIEQVLLPQYVIQ